MLIANWEQLLVRWLGIELVEVSGTEKLVAALGGGIAILCLVSVCAWSIPGPLSAAVVGSMGASAVLLFGVPHGSLSQPWPVMGGHMLSAAIGVTCAHFIGHSPLAAACAVGLSIGAMVQLKCIHPPGGATAFAAVLGGEAITELGYRFLVFPVLINALMMVLLATIFNLPFRWRRYPASLGARHQPTVNTVEEELKHDDIISALRSIDSFVDITEDDLLFLAEVLSKKANSR